MRKQHQIVTLPAPHARTSSRVTFRSDARPKSPITVVGSNVPAENATGLALVKELEDYLPDAILKLVRDAGHNIEDLSQEIPLEIAKTIRALFKRLAK